MSERNAAQGYIAVKKQSVPGTPVIPNAYVPYYSQGLTTDPHFQSDEPIFGRRYKRLQTYQGIRSHGGPIVVMAEPDSAPLFHDMCAATTAYSASGDPVFDYTFGESITVDPGDFTIDVSNGNYVERFWGCGGEKLTYAWNGEKMVFNIDVSALGSFNGREIASVTGSTVTLKTDYDPTPTTGLVATDLVKIVKSDGTSTNFTVSSFTATVVTLNASTAAFAAGDMLVLRPASVSLAFKVPFLWPRTQFFFAADAATALTNSATASNQTRLDPGTEISIMYPFENKEGTKRSGGFDPASLPRTVYDAEFKAKTFLDNPEKIKDWNALRKKALVMRSYSGTAHELRITLNDIKALTNDHPSESAAIIYHEFMYQPNFDTSDSQAFAVKILSPRAQ